MKRNDILWKGILEDLFDDFLRFFYTNADEIFDFQRGFEFLDKELDEIFPKKESSRYVDKLVKVYLKDGHEEWILVHIEIQGNNDNTFEERMFTYFYRIKDKYKHHITAWAIYTDTNKNYEPKMYSVDFLGTQLHYKFNTFKVLNQREEELKENNNPFAIVILTVLLALKKTKDNEVNLIDIKLDLVRHLFKKHKNKEKIRALMNFLAYYVRFNTQNTLIFEQKLDSFFGKSYPMGIEEQLLYLAENKGIQKGVKKGRQETEETKNYLFTKSLIQNTEFNNAKIAALVGVTEEFVQKIRFELDGK